MGGFFDFLGDVLNSSGGSSGSNRKREYTVSVVNVITGQKSFLKIEANSTQEARQIVLRDFPDYKINNVF